MNTEFAVGIYSAPDVDEKTAELLYRLARGPWPIKYVTVEFTDINNRKSQHENVLLVLGHVKTENLPPEIRKHQNFVTKLEVLGLQQHGPNTRWWWLDEEDSVGVFVGHMPLVEVRAVEQQFRFGRPGCRCENIHLK
ncbi:hypothetical protein AURDEDRAFT_176910 [Auricularia subglabra TFB-10046 SS5]|uniref:Uncharacterized protein n=1 Tax=Auricularia subglabra (strain TFB-10046 / SS5) TaxID=717982 RepID=J0WNS9_AURST|nr:hypothetical protein AURDEDRAFT_176910 [Auricularia subglabra TFB-10046 SS5]